MNTGLAGKTVIITGASRNMGRAAALAFASEGAHLALCTSTRMTELDAVADAVRGTGARAISVRCDITDADAVAGFVGRTVAEFGSVDVVVNMAGYRCEEPFLEESVAAWDRNIAVNLTGPFHICRNALPFMIEQRWGRIINISGVAPFVGGPAAKGMVKLGIVGLTRGLAQEFGRHNITANCIGPGYIARDSDTPETGKSIPPNLAIGRKGTYEEVVSLIVYLASEQAGFVTGQCYLANGGGYYS